MGEPTEIALVRMEGKLDRIGDAQRRFETDSADIRIRLNGIDDRTHKLEDWRTAQINERKGAVGTIRVLWAMGGAAMAAIASYFVQGGHGGGL